MKQAAQVKSVMMTNNRTQLITMEACIGRGFSGIQLIGNLSETCREGRERAKTALENMGIQLTQKKLLVNLSPADLKKEGNHFDLAIAVLMALLHNKAAPQISWDRWALIGELDLQGQLKPIQGSTGMILGALDCGLEGVIIPSSNLAELSALTPIMKQADLQVLGFDCLQDILDWTNPQKLQADDSTEELALSLAEAHKQNFDDMILPDELQRLIVCVMAGHHHLLLSGTPGCGKSMLAERLPCLMPRLTMTELKDVLKIYGLSRERLPPRVLAGWPPYRSPHHSLSQPALMGTPDRAGEVSLAHNGLLFLDEFPEFRRDAIEALREPLETGSIHVSRAKEKASWPARPQVVAACNLCPCGWQGSKIEICRCSTQQLLRYQSKLSGPIMDRIDIHFLMPETKTLDWQQSLSRPGQTRELLTAICTTEEFARRRNQNFEVQWNRQLALQHFPDASGHRDGDFAELLKSCSLKTASRRSLLKVLRVARTLADCDQSVVIAAKHLQQAWRWHRPIRPLDEGS